MKVRFAMTFLLGLLPAWKVKTRLLALVNGWRLAATSRVGPNIIWRVNELRMGELSRLGSFNVIRNINLLDLGDFSTVGQWNWISAAPEFKGGVDAGNLRMGRHSAITSRHYFDASGGVDIGEFSTIAGVRSTFITHGIDWRTNTQRSSSIRIGSRCLIGSNAACVPGAVVVDKTVVGMGSTLARTQGPGLVLGGRAAQVKELDGKYFVRLVGYVDVPS